MDGARVFNAATYLGSSRGRIARNVDTVMFCLSKGLGAPAGSMLVGPAEISRKAGSTGSVSAAGCGRRECWPRRDSSALERSPPRLGEDHANARLLADGLERMPGVQVSPVQTNIVIFDIRSRHDGGGR